MPHTRRPIEVKTAETPKAVNPRPAGRTEPALIGENSRRPARPLVSFPAKRPVEMEQPGCEPAAAVDDQVRSRFWVRPFPNEDVAFWRHNTSGEILGLPVAQHAIETFGNDGAILWLNSGCGALNNCRPVDLLATPEGEEEVDRILTCIDHGMIA